MARLDPIGSAVLITALILFVLAWTQVSVSGWSSSIFLAPLILSIALIVTFLFWERYRPQGFTLLPRDIWHYPNIIPLIIQSTSAFLWYATSQFRLATAFQDRLGQSTILAAVRLLPMGITGVLVGVAMQRIHFLITQPRWVQLFASCCCFAGSMLFAYCDAGLGVKYWRYIFPGEIVGTLGAMLAFIGMQTSIITSFPLGTCLHSSWRFECP